MWKDFLKKTKTKQTKKPLGWGNSAACICRDKKNEGGILFQVDMPCWKIILACVPSIHTTVHSHGAGRSEYLGKWEPGVNSSAKDRVADSYFSEPRPSFIVWLRSQLPATPCHHTHTNTQPPQNLSCNCSTQFENEKSISLGLNFQNSITEPSGGSQIERGSGGGFWTWLLAWCRTRLHFNTPASGGWCKVTVGSANKWDDWMMEKKRP